MHCTRKGQKKNKKNQQNKQKNQTKTKTAHSSLNIQLIHGNENWQKEEQNAVLNKYTFQPVQ